MIDIGSLATRLGAFELHADLAIPHGAVCALIGPSGGGKSTLLNAIAGFQPLDDGRIVIAGREISDLAPGARPVTMLFQEHNLFPRLSIAENVGLGIRPDLRLSPEDRRRIRGALAETGLAEMAERRPEALSGGQRQRAALARALLRARPVLLLDEPFAALGPALRRDMLDLTRRIASAREMTVLLVTHHPEDARRAADLTAFCADGRIDGAQPTTDLFAAPPPALASYLGEELR